MKKLLKRKVHSVVLFDGGMTLFIVMAALIMWVAGSK